MLPAGAGHDRARPSIHRAIRPRYRKRVDHFPKLGDGDTVEVHVRTKAGDQKTMPMPQGAVALIETMLDHLSRGDRVAVLSEDREVTPNEAATILGISRPLVVHRMELGDLPSVMSASTAARA
jgi:hypothetical protein